MHRHQMCIIIYHVARQESPACLLVSGHWSDFPRNRFFSICPWRRRVALSAKIQLFSRAGRLFFECVETKEKSAASWVFSEITFDIILVPSCRIQNTSYVAIKSNIDVIFQVILLVSDGKGWDQPACQEEWKTCRKKRRIVMPMWCTYIHVCTNVV
jgi:hypothetical protein